MPNSKLILRKSGLIAIALLFVCAVILSVSAWSSKLHSRQQSDQIENKTQAFEVVGISREANLIKISLRNNSYKNVQGYTLSVGNLKMEEDFIYSERVISPGEVYEVEFPVSGKSAALGQKISILGVIFEDHTSDGDPAIATAIRDRRLGEKLQLMRVNEILENSLKSPNGDPRNTLDQLKSQISSLPEISNTNPSQAINSGLHNLKEEALNSVQQLEQNRQAGALTDLYKELRNIKERNKEKAARL
jgi:hypothetical protein